MNDELSGQLTDSWRIPDYAQDALWLQTDSGSVQTEGPHGLFELDAPAQTLILRWGGEAGPALAYLRWQVDSLAWDGVIRVGGYIDSIHLTNVTSKLDPLAVITIVGQPLKSEGHGYQTAAQRHRLPYPPPNFHHSIAADVPGSVSTWLIPDASQFFGTVQETMMSNLRLHVYGNLADDASGWSSTFALPILLKSMTVFGP